MSASFDRALAVLLEHEGGFVDDAVDPGGTTKYGISHRAYPDLDIRALTLEQASAIYQRDYWAPIAGDRLPPAVALVVFDCAVNQGVGQAARVLQRAVGAAPDGVIGDLTIRAAWDRPAGRLVGELQAQRVLLYAEHAQWRHFGLGWMRRAFAVHAAALALA